MSGLFGTISWREEDSERQAADLAELIARRPRAAWHELETVRAGTATLAAVRPQSRIGLRSHCVAARDDVVAGVAASGDASQAARRLLEMEESAARTDRRLLPVGYGFARFQPGRVLLGTDRLGTHPLYMRRRPYGLAVASSALALARLEPVTRLDARGVALMLTLGQLCGSRTLFEEIEAVPPGTAWLVNATTRQEMRTPWPAWPDAGGGRQDRVESMVCALEASVSAAAHPGTAGLLLSGGVDSRFLAGLLAHGPARLRTYTFGAADCLDIRLATRVARELQVPHAIVPTTPANAVRVLRHGVALTDGMVSCLHFHGLELMPRLRAEADVQWNGFAGDAILGGTFAHPRYARCDASSIGQRLFAALNPLLPPGRLDRVLTTSAARELRESVAEEFDAAVRVAGAGRGAEIAFRVLMAERVGRLAAPGLALDRHYLPVAAPYASGPAVAQMLRLTAGERRFSRLLRAALKHAFPPLARIPWQRTGAPPATSWPLQAAVRAARGLAVRAGWTRSPAMIDYAAWLEGPLAPQRRELIGSLASLPLFDERRLRHRVAHPSPHEAQLDGVLMTLGAVQELLSGAGELPGEPDSPDS